MRLIGIILLCLLTSCDWGEVRQDRLDSLNTVQIPNEGDYSDGYDSLDIYANDLESIDSLIREEREDRLIKELVYCSILASTVDYPYNYLESSDWDNQYRLWTIAVILEYLLIDHPNCADNFSIQNTFLDLFAEVNSAKVEMQLLEPIKYANSIYVADIIINTFTK